MVRYGVKRRRGAQGAVLAGQQKDITLPLDLILRQSEYHPRSSSGRLHAKMEVELPQKNPAELYNTIIV